MKGAVCRTKTFGFRITNDISKHILIGGYMLRVGLTLFLAAVVLAFHFYFHSFNKLGLDELIEAEVRKITAREQMCQMTGDIALQIVNGAGENQVDNELSFSEGHFGVQVQN